LDRWQRAKVAQAIWRAYGSLCLSKGVSTAKRLGLELSPSVLARTDEVIE
jgi:hypothetical protein